MKHLVLKFLAIVALSLVIGAPAAQASHMTGGAITFECIAPNQYKVKISLFRDCLGINLTVPTTITASNNCGINIPINILPVAGTGAPVRAECDNEPTTCDGGTRYGVEKYEGFGFFTIPASTANTCQTWRFFWTTFARNNSTTVPFGNGFYIETIMYNRIGTDPLFCNNSPRFAFPYIPAFCLNEPVLFNIGAEEIDGDSLAFILVPALEAQGQSVVYGAGLSATQPVFTTSPIVINGINGNITFRTNQQQVGIFAVKIYEYRNQQIISEVTLDIQMLIDLGDFCDNVTPTYKIDTIGASCGQVMLPIKLNTPIACSSATPNGSDFRVYNALNGQGLSINSVLPIACNAEDRTDSLHILLFDTLAENGVYYLYSKFGDDGNTLGNKCLKFQNEFDTLVVVVSDCPPPPPPYTYNQPLTLTNVSVDSLTNTGCFAQWNAPVGFDSQYFLRYGINASPDPTTTPFALSAQVFNYSQLIGYDPSPLVPPNVNTYYYAIDLGLNNGTPNTPLSNDLNTIFLQNVPVSAPEDTTATITWNAYRGWVAPNYRIQYSKDQQPTQWIELGSTNNTTYTFRKPNEEGRYIVRVYTTNAPAALKSYSNWVPFQFERKDLVIPDIFTPNGDATNENFVVQQLEYYPNTNLKVHDRWGKIIYESTNYKNDWDGSNNASGIYYYTLKTADGQEFNGPLKIVR